MKVDVSGDKRLMRKLERLKGSVQRKIARRAATKAMTPMTKAVKRRAPVDEGDLQRSIGRKTKTFARAGVVWVGIGPRKGYGRMREDGTRKEPTKYAHLAERATHFMGRAFRAEVGGAERIFAREARAGIEQEARR